MYIKSNLLESLQVIGDIRSIILLWDKRQLNPSYIRRIFLILTLGLGFALALCNIKDILLMVELANTYKY